MTKQKPEHFQSRWGDNELDDSGYLYVPGWIMRHYHQLKNKKGEVTGLTPNEFTFLCHVMSFKYDVPAAQAKPSLETIAERAGRHVSNVRNWKDSLIEKGLLIVTHIEGKPSIYDFAELVKQCRKLASENTTPSEVTRGSEITSPTPSEITRTPLAESLGEESETKTEGKKQKKQTPLASDPLHRQKTDLIKAWWDALPEINRPLRPTPPKVYQAKAFLEDAEIGIRRGITPEKLTAYVKAVTYQGQYWHTRVLRFSTAIENAPGWCATNYRPLVQLQPAPEIVSEDELDPRIAAAFGDMVKAMSA